MEVQDVKSSWSCRDAVVDGTTLVGCETTRLDLPCPKYSARLLLLARFPQSSPTVVVVVVAGDPNS